MGKRKRIEDYGIRIGELPKGPLNKITDVRGVTVGHCTIDTDEHKTGVTVVMPMETGFSREKLVAGCHVLNGYGKTLGLMQIDEVGTLETPIALTNTLNVGLVHDALVDFMVREADKAGVDLKSTNPIVCECNDGYLSNIRKRAVGPEHVFEAIQSRAADFEEGDVGAGKGLSCHGFKGGIGSASRIVKLDGRDYTLGILVQSNHGLQKDLIVGGRHVGEEVARKLQIDENDSAGEGPPEGPDKGSVIMIIATDIPCSSRQLRRICKRAGVGLARLGSYIAHSSGEVVIAFSTAARLSSEDPRDIVPMEVMNEERMDWVFRAVAEACEEATLNSMVAAERVVGYSGNVRESLKDFL